MSTEFRALAVETGSQRCSIAVCAGEATALREWDAGAEESRRMLEWVESALGDLQLSLGELDCIALGCGPGGFTGLRVGAAAVQGLAYGASLPVCRISSLECLAATAIRQSPARLIVPAFDARMTQAYAGLYQAQSDGRLLALVADRLVEPDALRLTDWIDEPVLAVGSAWAAYPQLVANNAGLLASVDGSLSPCAADLLSLARLRWLDGDVVSAADAVPNYVRDDVTQ